jgi:ankyrin repeat protein
MQRNFNIPPLDVVRELLTHVPASLKSELPASAGHSIAPELAGESELTPLHLAAYSGSENVVRALLNSSGVQVDAASAPAVSTTSTFNAQHRISKPVALRRGNTGEKRRRKHSRNFNPKTFLLKLYLFTILNMSS